MAKNKKEQILQRGKQLKEELNSYDEIYFQSNESITSDSEFDRKFNEYKEIEKKFPELKDENSPTVKIGAEIVSSLEKINHPVPLLSIDNKSQKIGELLKWYKDIGYPQLLCQPKFDGLTIDSNYDKSKKLYDATRGNGYIGEIVSHNVKRVKSSLSEIEYNGYLELRGEGIIPFDIFKKKYMKTDKNPDGYSNPRNMASGNFSRLDNTEFKDSDVIYYDIGKFTDNEKYKLDTERLDFLKSQGFKVSPYILINTAEELEKVCSSYMNNLIQEDEGFNVLKIKDFTQVVCDGLVIKVNDLELREQLGTTSKGPKWAFAYKFKPLQAETVIHDITIGVGRTGRISPVANFHPIKLGGVTIKTATLNNFDFIEKLGEAYLDYDSLNVKDNNLYMTLKGKTFKIETILKVFNDKGDLFCYVLNNDYSMPFNMELEELLEQDLDLELMENTIPKLKFEIGDTLVVERSNDVIPKVIGIRFVDRFKLTKIYKNITPPTTCPDCKSPIYQEGILHFCRNLNCPSQLKRAIEHFASRDALNIMTLGEKIIDTFVEKGFIKSLIDIYSLDKHYDDLIKLDKFGKKKVDNLLNAVQSTKEVPFQRVLYSLGIEGIGKSTSKTLVEEYSTMEDLMKATKEDLIKIQDIGDITAQGIIDFFANEENKKLINSLKEVGLQFETEKKENASNKFEGCTFVITGTLKNSRDFYSTLVEQNGGKTSGSVSKKTTYVVVGIDAGSKETKALELIAKNAPIKMIYGHEEFMKLMES